jgi:predicted dehydrogenase
MKKVCIVGFGGMGMRHAKDLVEFTDGQIEIAGVLEPSDASYERGCTWMGARPARFFSIPEMLDRCKPDGAVISTPNYLHLECLLEFAGRNIPLILEKPLDTNLEKVSRIVAFAEKYAAPIMVHHVMRYSPIVLKAKEIIDSGAIGEVGGFQFCQFAGGGGMFHNFRRTFKTGGGQLLEKATHDFDVLLFLTGATPSRVAATCRRRVFGGDKPNDLTCSKCPEITTCEYAEKQTANENETTSTNDLCVYAREIDIYDLESCLIELDNGVIGTYSECFFAKAPFTRRYEFNCTRGFLSIDFSARQLYWTNGQQEETLKFDYEGRIHYNGAPGVAKHFLELMQGRTTAVHSPVDEAYAAELISFAAYQSNASGGFVRISDVAGCGTT